MVKPVTVDADTAVKKAVVKSALSPERTAKGRLSKTVPMAINIKNPRAIICTWLNLSLCFIILCQPYFFHT